MRQTNCGSAPLCGADRSLVAGNASLVAVAALFLTAITPAVAQLAPPTSNRGVSMGHLHIRVKDPAAQKQFWTNFGGKPVKNGNLELIELPGVYIQFRQGDATGGTVGSVVNHVGFSVQDSAAMVAKWNAAGIQTEKGNGATQYYITTADGLRIEILEDKAQAIPLKFQHVHFNVPPDAVAEMQAWYARVFDAVPAPPGRFKAGVVAGASLTYGESKEKQETTKGRALDHIGFDVPSLDFTFTKLQAQGIKFDAEPKVVNDGRTKNAFLTDPWGTYIEITEGIAPH